MAISKYWDEQLDSWCIAQMEAPCHEAVKTLAKSRGFNKHFDEFNGASISATIQHENLVVAYSVAGSSWTHFEAVYSRSLNESAIILATKKLKTQALIVGMEDSIGAFCYDHYRNGRPIEQYACTDPEFHELSIEECRAKGWQVCETGHSRLKTKRSVDLKSDLLSGLTDELGLDIPRPQWTFAASPPRVEQYLPEKDRQPIGCAFLLYLS